jgi:hypothetical protein
MLLFAGTVEVEGNDRSSNNSGRYDNDRGGNNDHG